MSCVRNTALWATTVLGLLLLMTVVARPPAVRTAPRSRGLSRPPVEEILILVGSINPANTAPQKWLCLAGGWSASRGWVRPPERVMPGLWRATEWQLFPLSAANSVTVRSEAVPVPAEGLDCASYSLLAPSRGGAAVTRASRPRPRRALPEKRRRTELGAATRQLLARHGIPPPAKPRVVESWRVDLNGDGREELLWTARSRDAWTSPYRDTDLPGHVRPGDYALLGLRFAFGTRVRLLALAVASASSAAPTYRILCPLDVNGDGRMEILAHAQYFEEEELLSYTFDGQRVAAVLDTRLPRPGRTANAILGD